MKTLFKFCFAAIAVLAATPARSSPLWTAERRECRIYLAGIAHRSEIAPTAWFDNSRLPPPRFLSRVWFEANLGSPEAVAWAGTKIAGATTERADIFRLLSNDDAKLLRGRLNALGLNSDSAHVRSLQPWALALIIGSVDPQGNGAGAATQRFDIETVARAAYAKLGVPVDYLEDIESHVDALRAIPQRSQLNVLKAALHPEREPSQRALHQAWLSGDLQLAEDLQSQISIFKDPDYRENIIEKRNLKWSKILGQCNEPENSLVIVGLGHLVGRNSVLHYLEREGFSVRNTAQ